MWLGGGRLNNPYWATWVGADPLRQRRAYELTKRYMRRPAEQLQRPLSAPLCLDVGEGGEQQQVLRVQ